MTPRFQFVSLQEASRQARRERQIESARAIRGLGNRTPEQLVDCCDALMGEASQSVVMFRSSQGRVHVY